MKAVIYLFIFLVGSCGGAPSGNPKPVDLYDTTWHHKDTTIYKPVYIPKPVDSPYMVGRKIDSPYVVGRRIDSPYYVGRRIDSPYYVKRKIDSPYTVGRPVDSPYIVWHTIPKDSIKWNIQNKDTSVVIPLYVDKRLTPYLKDTLKIKFKITYAR
jgi:hypothetical protein